MPRVLVLSGPNHWFDKCAPIAAASLASHPDLQVTLTDDQAILATADERTGLPSFDVLVHGTGFTRRERQADGTFRTVAALAPAEERGLFDFVRGGKGFVGVHGTGWWIGGEAFRLVGGHANWHPAGLEFAVEFTDRDHPITRDLEDFRLTDEIYMSAWDPAIHVLATATWAERRHPVVWTHAYGQGRVFYTTLGHGPSTFEQPGFQRLLTRGVLWAAGAG